MRRLKASRIVLAVVVLLLSFFMNNSNLVLSHVEETAKDLSIESMAEAEIWSMSGTFVYEAATTIADMDGDGSKEVIVGGRGLNPDGSLACNGKVYVYHGDGSLKWEKVVRAGVNSSPTVEDINGDQIKDIVVGMGAWHDPEIKYEDASNECGIGDPDAYGNGGVVALDGRNGDRLWVFDTQDWGEWGGSGAVGTHGASNGVLDGVFSSPAVGDILRNGEPEVVVGSWDNCIYLLDKDGKPLWDRVPFDYSNPEAGIDFCGGHGFFNHDTVWSSPALADLTGDGQLEIVIGGDISCDVYGDPDLCNRYMEPDGGFLWVIKANGTPLSRRWMDQAIQSSPAIADLERDGVLDIVVGTGQSFANKGYYVTAWTVDASLPITESLVLKWRADVVGRTLSSPALGDLNGDGVLDVVVITKYGDWGVPVGPEYNNGSYVYALDGRDGKILWKTHSCNNDSIGRSFPVNASPILMDIVGDERPEVLFPHAWEIAVLNPDGTYYTKVNTANGCTDSSGDTLYSGYGSFSASIAVADLRGDGKVEIVAPGRWDEESGSLQGAIYVWEVNSSSEDIWPMFHRDPQHTGYYPSPPRLEVTPDSLYLLHQYGSGETTRAQIHIRNAGDGTLDWQITSSLPCSATFTPSGGGVEFSTSATVTIDVASYLTGTYTLGDITVTALLNGENVAGSPAEIPVTLYVGKVHSAYLPLVSR
ncbi:MAG: FG-GAP-like repeat-containing protein [Anaerolineae bacterium]